MFKRSLLSRSIAASIVLASVPMLAQAQDSQDEPLLEEVVVTGIRASLNKAIDIKRDSMEVMDSIVAEDIGKLPDNNVVESLQRVAGVQVTDRAGGEANTVSIRGLTDISTMVNGRTIFTASGREVELADIPSTLVSRIDVIKNRSAKGYENGIAGQIDVHTFRPFDFDGSRVSIAGRAIYMEEAEKTDPVISGLFSNRWDTNAGDFGALINISHARTNYRDQSVTPGAQVVFMTENPTAPWTPLERIFPDDERAQEVVDGGDIWTPGLDNGLSTTPGSTVTVNGEETPYYLSRDAMFQSDLTGERERDAANISLQFAPNDRAEYTFEAFYNGYRNESFNSLHFAFVDWWGSLSELGDIEDTFELYEGTNVIRERTIRHPFTFGSGDYATGKTDSFMYALAGDWELASNFNLNSELVYQDSEFESSFIAMRSNAGRYQTTANFSNTPSISFEDNPATEVDESDLTDIAQYEMAEMYDSGERNEGSAVTFTADAEYFTDSGFFTKLDFGIRYDDRDSKEYSREQSADPCAVVNLETGIDPEDCLFSSYVDEGIAHINSGFMDSLDVPRTWAVADGPYLRSNRNYFLGLYGMEPDQVMREEFSVNETNAAIYGSSEFETELLGKRLDGHIGFRYVDVTTDTAFTDQVDGERTEDSVDTSEFMPNLAIRVHLTDDLMLRLSYGETLRMPWFGDLNPTITYFDDITSIGYGTASSGNRNLQPTTSQNIDLSLEWYFGDASSAYLTLFKRDIEGLVYGFSTRVNREIEDFDTDTFILTRPENASDGTLTGAELGWTYFPENLPGYWDGIGLQTSFTFLDSEQVIPTFDDQGLPDGTEKTDMFGVSDTSYSLAVAYERDSFDARLAYVWRSDFLNDQESKLFANPLGVYRDEQQSLDLQLSYNITEELLVTFDATNLTEEVNQSRYGNSQLHTFGNWQISRTFALGARYSF